MARPAYVEIRPNALMHNISYLRRLAPNSKLLAVVKANAYGHGVCDLIPELHCADAVGVCCLEEALSLQQSGFSKPILILEGFFDQSELSLIDVSRFWTVIRDWTQLKLLQRHSFKNQLHYWLKFNTGMNRLGFKPDDYTDILSLISDNSLIPQPAVMMTHFACADLFDHDFTKKQIGIFLEMLGQHSYSLSMANSAAILKWPESHGQWIRPGLALYGVSPFLQTTGLDIGLQPVMSLKSEIIAIQSCEKGDIIGYGATYRCEKPMKIGVVAMGYADGYPQQAQNGTPVMVQGRQTYIVGRVSMDMITIDLTDFSDINIGESVTLWGDELPIEQIALNAKTSPYELMCRINNRVQRRIIR